MKTDKQSAATALNVLSGQVNGIPNDKNGSFVQDTSSAFPQAPPSAATFSPASAIDKLDCFINEREQYPAAAVQPVYKSCGPARPRADERGLRC